MSTGGICPPPTAMCPSSYDAAKADPAMCPYQSQICEYAQGTCICADGLGLPMPGGPKWQCIPVQAGCPSPRPELGSPCSTPEKTICDYGGCGGGVDMSCVGGYWAVAITVCPA